MRWTEVTEEGFRGGPVMPDNYDGSPRATEQLRANIARAGIVGSLVGNDFKSSMMVVPLLDADPDTGKRHRLPRAVARRSSRASAPSTRGDGRRQASKIHVIGFAKLVGDLIDGLVQVALYFGLAAADRRADHLAATRAACAAPRWWSPARWSPWSGSSAWCGCSASSSTRISILVPFLVFAIGVSATARRR